MSSIFFPFPLPLNGRQIFYISILQGLGAGLIDGGINFAIAYAMYHGQSDVRMWVFSKNTLAGDLGVTCLIQTAVSMLISSTLVHSDIHHSAIKPLPFVYPHVTHLPDPALLWRKSSSSDDTNSPPSSDSSEKPQNGGTKSKKGFGYYWRMLLRFTFEGTERNIILEACGARDWFGRLGWTILQGLSLAVFFGLPLWILAIIIVGPIYKGGNVGNQWAPQVIKLVFAFLLGIITNPIIALMALGSQAQHHLIPLTTPPSTSTLVPPPSSPTLSHRPPLVANVSLLAPLGSTESPLFPPPPPPGMGRPRALTNASSTGSIYSLGGSGGRAQRPRAGSRSSSTGGGGNGLAPPSFGGGRERSGSYGGRDRSGSVATGTGTGRGRAESVGGERKAIPSSWTGEGTGPAGARLRETEREGLETPRESLEGRPSVTVGEGDGEDRERPVGEMTKEEVERELGEKKEVV